MTTEPYTCKTCGEENVFARYIEPTRSEMLEQQHCFNCHFWTHYVSIKDDPTIFRYKGKHFKTAPEDQKGFRGYSGAKFTIVTAMGEEIVTSNLWHQGTIPDRFKDQLPDNCIIHGIA